MQSDNGKLFIGGTSWDTNESKLKEYFSAFGEVVEAIIMRDQSTGRARGFGFVVFADPAVAEQVIKEKHSIDGRMVEAKRAVPREDPNISSRYSRSTHNSPCPGRTKKIFVGGLPSIVTESEFKQYFEQFGTINDVVVMYDHNTQRPRGFGFITYDSVESVDKVLLSHFHELKGKMVEVKRAVPKELSPGPNNEQLSGYNFGINRLSSFLGGYPHGFTPTNLGGYGLRMDGRFSHLMGGRSGFPTFSSGYGIGVNFEGSYVGTVNFNGNLNYGRGLNLSYSNSNRLNSPIGYNGVSGGNSSFFSSSPRDLWGNGTLGYDLNPTNSSSYIGSGNINNRGRNFGNSGANWGSTQVTSQGGGSNVSNEISSLGYNFVDNGYNSGTGEYRRSNGTSNLSGSSYGAQDSSYDGPLADLYSARSVYGDSTWQSANPERGGSGSFDYGLSNAASEVSTKNSPSFVGDHNFNKRQSTRGIAT